MRRGAHKLIYWPQLKLTALYNVETDIAESTDLSRTNPELTSQMLAELQAWEPFNKILSAPPKKAKAKKPRKNKKK